MELKHLLQKISRETYQPSRSGFIRLDIRTINEPTYWPGCIQLHKAKKSGEHYDLRFGPPGELMYSWAIRKKMPNHGEKHLAVRTFAHDPDWCNFKGEIGSGYGAGTVDIVYNGPFLIVEANEQKIKFVVNIHGEPEEFTMIHQNDNNWLIINTTPTKAKYNIPTDKPKMKELSLNDDKLDIKLNRILEDDYIILPKFDGTHSLLYLEPNKQIRIFSRVSPKHKETGLIDYTYKIPELIGKKTPPDIPESILRAEIFGYKKDTNKMVPVHDIVSILHTKNPLESHLKMKEKNIELAIYPFEVHSIGGHKIEEPYINQLNLLQEISDKLPSAVWKPIPITNKKDKELIIDDILTNRNALNIDYFEEGAIARNLYNNTAIKIKRKNIWDVYIQDIKRGTGERQNEAGSIGYSFGPNEPIVGWVNTAPLPQKMRQDMLKYPNRFKNVSLRISGTQLGTDNAIRQPVIEDIHESKTLEQGKLEDVLKYIQ